MKNYRLLILFVITISVFGLSRCRKDIENILEKDGPKIVATPYDFIVPKGFPKPFIPADNPMTVEGVELGRHLFYDKRLSKDLSMSCGSCHGQRAAFGDPAFKQFSEGIHGDKTRRNAMPLFNLAWQEVFFWDGRAKTLEEQAAMPVVDQLELANDWPTVLSRLQADSTYPEMFKAAFGDEEINMDRTTKAIAQFERSIVSANSEFDQVVRLKTKEKFDIRSDRLGDPNAGYRDFSLETFDCFHCHGVKETSYLMGAYGRDLQFLNNGLQTEEEMNNDPGRAEVTGNANDRGKFKVPSLRNIEWSFPFMHDGSIPNLDSLVQFYNFGGHKTSTVDANMEKAGIGRNWTPEQMEDLAAFLLTLTDQEFRNNPAYSDPFEEQ